MSSIENKKSVIRKKLEEIEDEIHRSWLKDFDKTKEIKELELILENILKLDSIEQFFENDQADFNYFIGKFSKETIENILKQHYIIGENGDDIAFGVIMNYLKLFLKFIEKPQYIPLWESIKEIFESQKSYYRGHSYGSNRVLNEKKVTSAEKFNENLTRIETSAITLTEGMEIDVFTENRKSYNPNQERKIWTRGKISKIEKDYLVIHIADDTESIYMKKTSFDYAEKGKMAKDHEWRVSLSPGDVIDCYDRGKWYPSTILNVKKEMSNGLPKVEYKIGFRLYLEFFEKWKDYQKLWPDKSLQKDSIGREFIGDSENIDETIPSYSKRIQKLDYSSGSEKNNENESPENYFIDDYIKVRKKLNF